LRYVKIKKVAEANQAALRDYIQQAIVFDQG